MLLAAVCACSFVFAADKDADVAGNPNSKVNSLRPVKLAKVPSRNSDVDVPGNPNSKVNALRAPKLEKIERAPTANVRPPAGPPRPDTTARDINPNINR